MKIVLFERWHGSTQECGISKQYAHFCNFQSLPKIENAHLGCRDPLGLSGKNIYLYSNMYIYYLPDGLKRKFLKEGDSVRYDRESPEYDMSAFIPVEMKAGSLILLHGDLVHQRCCSGCLPYNFE